MTTNNSICDINIFVAHSQIIRYLRLDMITSTLVLSLRPRACHITASVAASAGLSGLVITGVGSRVEKKLVLSQNLK